MNKNKRASGEIAKLKAKLAARDETIAKQSAVLSEVVEIIENLNDVLRDANFMKPEEIPFKDVAPELRTEGELRRKLKRKKKLS